MSAKGGITEGKSHKEGGIPMEVKSTGQKVELEGGEGVINKRNMASEKTFEFEGKEKTICEIASEINSADGNGVQIDCDNVTGKKYEYATGGKILDEESEANFKEWMDDGNVYEVEDGVYATQDAQWTNRVKGMDELRRYYAKEFLSDKYEGGGSVEDYESLIGKYVNIYPMGVSLPTEHQIKDVMVSGEQFRHRDIFLKFDIGNAKIPLNEAYSFMQNGIIFVKDSKEEYGIQLIPNQYAKGGGVGSLGHYTAIANMGIRKIKRNLDSVLEVQEFMTEMADKNAISVEITKINQEGKKQTIIYEWSGSDWEIISKSDIYENGGDVRDFDWYKGFKKDQLKKGTEHEMEHIDTIREFKKEGVSDRQVAKAIAKDHLEEDENYYIELDKMESSRKLSDAIKEFEKYKGYRKNTRKYKHGGFMGNSNEVVHITFNSDVDAVIRDKEGKYIGESRFPKETIYKFTFKDNDGRNSTLELLKGAFIVVPNEKINIVGFNEEKFGNGGNVKPYQSIPLNENDKEIAKLLTKYEDPSSFNSRQRQKLSTFRGTNVVNELSTSIIQKIYGLMFEYHNVENPIKNLYLSNVGAGNIVSYAPKYIDKLMIDFDESNRFVEIEKEINAIINVDKKYILSNTMDIREMDAFIHVYSNTNPDKEELNYLFLQSQKTAIGLGVCEFTSRERLDKFQRQIVENQGGFAQNQMLMYKNANKYLIVKEGITDKGQYTLMYIISKM